LIVLARLGEAQVQENKESDKSDGFFHTANDRGIARGRDGPTRFRKNGF
jgi:hypothetical protein